MGCDMLILNREFKVPDDGWYQLAPLGEFPHACAGVIQVIDGESCVAMAARFAADAAVANFAGLLIDFDHFSMQGGQRSEAAGWITALEARCQTTDDRLQTADQDGAAGGRRPTPETSGLWAQIRWSDVGEAAVMGGRYRFLSPVWSREDCVELGIDAAAALPRLRPIRLLNAAVTNDPNLKGMRPLSNSGRMTEDSGRTEGTSGAGDGQGVENRHSYRDTDGRAEGGDLKPEFRTGEKTMKSVIEKLLNHLGLAADATEAVVLEKLGALPALTVVTELQNSLRLVETERDALKATVTTVEGELLNRDLETFAGVISDGTKAFWSEQLLSNRTGARAVLAEMVKATATPGAATPKPLHNRATARPVPPGQMTGINSTGSGQAVTDGESKAMKIRNRAHEIAKAEGVPFSLAFRRAEREVIGQ